MILPSITGMPSRNDSSSPCGTYQFRVVGIRGVSLRLMKVAGRAIRTFVEFPSMDLIGQKETVWPDNDGGLSSSPGERLKSLARDCIQVRHL